MIEAHGKFISGDEKLESKWNMCHDMNGVDMFVDIFSWAHLVLFKLETYIIHILNNMR